MIYEKILLKKIRQQLIKQGSFSILFPFQHYSRFISVLPIYFFSVLAFRPCCCVSTMRWYFCSVIPESPRWLLTKGREEEARETIEKICKKNGLPYKSTMKVADEVSLLLFFFFPSSTYVLTSSAQRYFIHHAVNPRQD